MGDTENTSKTSGLLARIRALQEEELKKSQEPQIADSIDSDFSFPETSFEASFNSQDFDFNQPKESFFENLSPETDIFAEDIPSNITEIEPEIKGPGRNPWVSKVSKNCWILDAKICRILNAKKCWKVLAIYKSMRKKPFF